MDDCVFCRIINGQIPCWKVLETEHALAFLDMEPIVEYHTLVIPKAHYKDIFSVPEEVLCQTGAAIKQVIRLYQEKLGIENMHLFNNSGSLARQTVFHLHFHIVPVKPEKPLVGFMKHPELVTKYPDMLKALGL
ncbi:MAG: HIT domain-containing protein [Anaerolineaceae bacterium]